jgi:hypothetical protein
VSYHERPGTTGPDPLLAGVAQSQVSAAINISLCLDNVCSGKVEYIELDVPGNNQGAAAQHFLLNYTEVATFIGITVIGTTADPVPKFTIRFLPERVQAQVAELRKTESDTTIANLVRTKKLFGYKGLRTLYLRYHASWLEHSLATVKNKPAGTIKNEAQRVRTVRTQAFEAAKVQLLSDKHVLETRSMSENAGLITVITAKLLVLEQDFNNYIRVLAQNEIGQLKCRAEYVETQAKAKKATSVSATPALSTPLTPVTTPAAPTDPITSAVASALPITPAATPAAPTAPTAAGPSSAPTAPAVSPAATVASPASTSSDKPVASPTQQTIVEAIRLGLLSFGKK